MARFILQSGNICMTEKRAVKTITNDFISIAYDNLHEISFHATPIGSVEFCIKYLVQQYIKIPEHLSYPESLFGYFGRNLYKEFYNNVKDGSFVKPVDEIKSFTGHIKGETTETLPENINEMLVWYSSKITFVAEWRIYVCEKEILGFSRYDDSDIEYPKPSSELITNIINDFINQPIAYSIDIGLTDKNEYTIVELNDAWALGYYPWGTMTKENYICMIEKRWKEITQSYY